MVGKLLAEKAQQSFIELEDELESEYQNAKENAKAELNNEQLLKVEKDLLEKLMSRKNKVIAVNTDLIRDEELANILPKVGTVVYLQTEREDLCIRTKQDSMEEANENYFDEEKYRRQVEKNEPIFFKISGIIIRTADKTVEEIVEEILLLI